VFFTPRNFGKGLTRYERRRPHLFSSAPTRSEYPQHNATGRTSPTIRTPPPFLFFFSLPTRIPDPRLARRSNPATQNRADLLFWVFPFPDLSPSRKAGNPVLSSPSAFHPTAQLCTNVSGRRFLFSFSFRPRAPSCLPFRIKRVRTFRTRPSLASPLLPTRPITSFHTHHHQLRIFRASQRRDPHHNIHRTHPSLRFASCPLFPIARRTALTICARRISPRRIRYMVANLREAELMSHNLI
jgi:hypothetical protein